jgi:hypothetical protein
MEMHEQTPWVRIEAETATGSALIQRIWAGRPMISVQPFMPHFECGEVAVNQHSNLGNWSRCGGGLLVENIT